MKRKNLTSIELLPYLTCERFEPTPIKKRWHERTIRRAQLLWREIKDGAVYWFLDTFLGAENCQELWGMEVEQAQVLLQQRKRICANAGVTLEPSPFTRYAMRFPQKTEAFLQNTSVVKKEAVDDVFMGLRKQLATLKANFSSQFEENDR